MKATTQKQFAYVDGVRTKELDKVSPPQWRYLFSISAGKRTQETFATRASLFRRGLIIGTMLSDARDTARCASNGGRRHEHARTE